MLLNLPLTFTGLLAFTRLLTWVGLAILARLPALAWLTVGGIGAARGTTDLVGSSLPGGLTLGELFAGQPGDRRRFARLTVGRVAGRIVGSRGAAGVRAVGAGEAAVGLGGEVFEFGLGPLERGGLIAEDAPGGFFDPFAEAVEGFAGQAGGAGGFIG